MTTPFLRSLRCMFPDAKISYLVGNWSKDAIKYNSNINNFLIFDETIFFNIKKMPNLIRFILEIRKKNFDAAFILDASFIYPVIIYLTGISRRIGFDRNGEGFALTDRIEFKYSHHHINNYLNLLTILNTDSIFASLNMEFNYSKTDEEFAFHFYSDNKFCLNDFIIGIAPGGAKNIAESMPLRQWPIEYYIELIKKIKEKFNSKIILFGGYNDLDICGKIEEVFMDKIYNLSGKTTLAQAAAIIKSCNYFITHDSGLMHLAAAMGITTISIFGPTEPLEKAPLNSDKFVLFKKINCSPCYKDGIYPDCSHKTCLRLIKPDDIINLINNEFYYKNHF